MAKRVPVLAAREIAVRVAPLVAALVGVAALGVTFDAIRAQGRTARLHLPFLADIRAPYSVDHADTGISIQNTDLDDPAAILVELYPQTEGQDGRQVALTAPPGGTAYLYLPSGPVPPDGLLAAIVHSDWPVAAIARTDWPAPAAATIYSDVVPAVEAALALVAVAYHGQCSVISIQNTNTTARAAAVVEFYRTGEPTPTMTTEVTIRPGTSVTLRPCENESMRTRLGAGFLGSLRVRSKDGSTQFGLQSYVTIDGQPKAAYAFEGVPIESASRVLYVPLFRASQRLGSDTVGDTGISVLNASQNDVDVTATYYPSSLAPSACGRSPITQQRRLTASSSLVFWQGPGGGPVPPRCFGSARLEASGPILAVVVDAVDRPAVGQYNVQAAAYNAMALEWTGPVQALPLFRTGHSKSNLWTGISAMNVGSGDATVRLSVTNAVTGVTIPDAMTATVAPNETAIFWPEPIRQRYPWNIVSHAYGSATISSDQPVAVMVNDASPSGRFGMQLDAAAYVGIPIGR